MFVTRLMDTRKGNCHSLPFFYKILVEEVGAEAYLAMAPAHIYIKHQDETGKWVNIELTNGGNFTSDAWIISSMGITSEAIKSGIYMEPLTLQQSVALTMYDLAMGYKEKFGHSETVVMMCDKVLEFYPNCLVAIMLKYDCYAIEGQKLFEMKEKDEYITERLIEIRSMMTKLHNQIQSLGHREMTEAEYEEWNRSMEEEIKRQKIEETNKE
jgi:hypothetical protein